MISQGSDDTSCMEDADKGASTSQEVFKQQLVQHLDWFAERGLTVSFWWRDDDATVPSIELEKTLGLSERFSVPLALAVIPNFASNALADLLKTTSQTCVLQHGWQHKNYQEKSLGEKASEFGWRRSEQDMRREISEGREILQGLFGEQFIPVFVPPWNRIGPLAVKTLRNMEVYGLSAFTWINHYCLPHIQSHLDIIKWKKNKRFIGWDAAMRRLDLQLCRRRNNNTEPIGLLTHHLDHGQGCEEFLEVFFSVTKQHPAAKWLSAKELLERADHDFNQSI